MRASALLPPEPLRHPGTLFVAYWKDDRSSLQLLLFRPFDYGHPNPYADPLIESFVERAQAHLQRIVGPRYIGIKQ